MRVYLVTIFVTITSCTSTHVALWNILLPAVRKASRGVFIAASSRARRSWPLNCFTNSVTLAILASFEVGYQDYVPSLRLRGRWLAQHGFNVGARIYISVTGCSRYGKMVCRVPIIDSIV